MLLSDQPGIADEVEAEAESDAAEEEGQTARPTLIKQQEPNPVPKTTTAWQEYYDQMGVARQQIIKRLADMREYNVQLQPVYDEHDRTKLVTPDEKAIFVRRKISTKDYFEVEQMREEMRDLRTTDRKAVTLAMVEIYKNLALVYLGDKKTGKPITPEMFYRCHWPTVKAILDACNLGSVMGQVPLDDEILNP